MASVTYKKDALPKTVKEDGGSPDRRIHYVAGTIITIRAWNVRTMLETGKTAQVAAEMRIGPTALPSLESKSQDGLVSVRGG